MMILDNKEIIYLKYCIISQVFCQLLLFLLENRTSLLQGDPKLHLLSNQLAVNKT